MKRRIYLRTLWFVAYNWAPPFFFGALFAMFIVWWDLEMIVEAFMTSINATVASCAQ
ncbi:MAG: hypothetical protein ACRCTL_12085 [Pseudomonas sp.]